ncbi:MAG: HPr family phosphocarrier protein [Phycisphaerales bacterium]|nr:HPr family phosphocarrier protein [Phycisphaerales bacterium]
MPQRTVQVTIVNRLGMHARPAMAFVDCAAGFASAVTVRKGETSVDGKSIMQMMMLAATRGTVLEVCVDGDDADAACEALAALVAAGFEED